jgi:O-methyltransferase
MYFPEHKYKEFFARVEPFTMTSYERVKALVDSVQYATLNGIPGDIVECGVWRGGSMMAVILALQELGSCDRDLYLYDTFEGMTEPDQFDLSDIADSSTQKIEKGSFAVPVREVEANLLSMGYPREKISFVKGPVEETLSGSRHAKIAILRLDTDWYASTRAELEILYPCIVAAGVLIIDDYGHWQGAKKATDEFFGRQSFRPYLHQIDYTGRLIIKR